jgi:hypothetical protein
VRSRYTLPAGLLATCAAAALVGAISARHQHTDAGGQSLASEAPARSTVAAAPNEVSGAGPATQDVPATVEEAPPTPDVADLDPDEAADDPETAAGLAELERLREIPGAAALVDDIIDYLENGDPNDFSLANLPVDERGFATVDDHYLEKMIKDPVIREKWKKLMELEAGSAH